MIRPVLTELGIFLIPFAAYALFLIATRSGVFAQSSWPAHLVAKLVLGSLLLVIVSFILLAHFTGAPPDSTYVPAHIENGKFVPGRETEPGNERAARARSMRRGYSGPAARVLALLNGDGEEARVVGGAVRNALLKSRPAISTSRPRRCPMKWCGAPRRPASMVPTGIEHGTVTLVVDGAAVRGHDLARGYRDLWPQGQGRVRPRLGSRRGAARFHHQRAVGRCRRRRARLCRRARRYRSPSRALHRRCRPAHRRGLSAHPAFLPHSCRLRSGRTRPRRISRLHRRARGMVGCRRNGCGWKC